MPTITVNTNSTNTGLLPSDLSQYDNWLSQYNPNAVSIYQDQDNVCTGLLNLDGNFNIYLQTYGYNSFGFVNGNEMQVTAGPYTEDFYGSFSSTYSDVNKIFWYDSASGSSASESGNFVFNGYPLNATLQVGSTMTAATDLVPNPVAPNSNIGDVVLLNTAWNGSYWSGTISAYSEAISDTTSGETAQVTFLEKPTPISYQSSSLGVQGFLNFSQVPVVDGYAITVSNYNTGVQSDNVLVSGFSYSASGVAADNALPPAIAGTDTVSVTGNGEVNPIPLMDAYSSEINGVSFADSAANVQANLGPLETLAAEGKLGTISLTDAGTPTITMTPSAASADAAVLSHIITPYTQVMLACYAADTRIATERGDAMVQHLRIGDRVRLADGGTAPIVWLGRRTVDCRCHPRREDALPVRIAAHAFGMDRPRRDVVLSPDHAVYMEEVLIPIRYLLNDATVRQEQADRVTYWHIELAAHAVLLAEGLPAESYLDTGNRAAFANGGRTTTVHPNFAHSVWDQRGCAPLVTSGPTFDLVYRRLIAQALALGWRSENAGNNGTRWRPPASGLDETVLYAA